jgi:TRAP-type C4-dicarboxylate transport system substrate-binding protein
MLPRIRHIALIAAAVGVLAGCGSASDRAGGTRPADRVVLTMANGNGTSIELDPFAKAVARLSHGALAIRFHNAWRGGTTDYERGIIRDVAAGGADLGWVGTRAFDDAGVRAFDALHAPLLVDSYDTERRVLEGPLAGQMLAALPHGLAGIGVLPGPMRKPLGIAPLTEPADFRGRAVAMTRSAVASATLHALGARGVAIPRGGDITGLDGIEQQVDSIQGNGYDAGAKYLTADVNLWPRPLVLFASRRTFDRLTAQQRDVLRRAAAESVGPTLTQIEHDERDAAGILCRRGVEFVTAGASRLAALRRAVAPVYQRLERDAQTRRAIEQIRATGTGATPSTLPRCSHPGQTAASRARTRLDGVWVLHTTANDLRKIGTPEQDINPENYGESSMSLSRGRFVQRQPAGDSAAGSYTVKDHILTLTAETTSGGQARTRVGEVFTFRWSLYRDRLTLSRVRGKVSPEPMIARPWQRAG